MRRLVAAVSAVTLVAVVLVIIPASAVATESVRVGGDTGLSWVSLGDSYAAGEGLPDPTRIEGDETFALCQRALAGDGGSTAWGAQAAAGRADAGHFAFVACTGAITDDVFPHPSAPRIQAGQLDQARFFGKSERFDVVTASFGGNNVGFADVLLGCAGVSVTGAGTYALTGAVSWAAAPWVGCTVSEEEMKARVDRLTDTATVRGGRMDCGDLGATGSTSAFWDDDDLVAGKVTAPELYDVLGRCVAEPGGVVVVMGYPQLVEESGRWSALEGNRCHRVRRADAGKLRGAVARFNERLRAAAEFADRTTPARFVFVDPNQFWEGEAYTGSAPSSEALAQGAKRHALCGGGEDWLNGLTIGTAGDGALRPQRSFHPNQLGHNAMAQATQTIDLTPQPPAPVTVEELKSFTLPHDLCGDGTPAGDHTLTDGEYRVPGDPDLFIGTSSQTLGDLDGDGLGDGAFTFGCYNGIADHQDSAAVVRALDRTLEVVSLYQVGESGPTDVSSLAITDGRLVASGAIAIDEPLCCPTGFWKGTFAWTGSGFTQESVQVIDGEVRTRQLVDALTRNDRAQIAAMMAEGWEDYFDDGIAEGATWTFDGCERLSFGATEECRILGNGTAYFVSWVSEGDGYDPGHLVAEPVIYGD